MKIEKLAFALLLLFLSSCQNNAYKYLSKRKYLECKQIGFVAQLSESYPYYEQFRDQTDILQLHTYINSENLRIRTYSYWALLEKMEEGYLEVFDLALKETEVIGFHCGCTSSLENIAFSTYLNFFEKEIKFEGDSMIIQKRFKKLYLLDSMIIHHPIQNENLIKLAKKSGEYKTK
ncbi:MAG: hypothetical protein AAFO07_07705 [Bacteroidota bacterium]